MLKIVYTVLYGKPIAELQSVTYQVKMFMTPQSLYSRPRKKKGK